MATSPVHTPPPPPHPTDAQTSPVVTNAFPLQSFVDDDASVRSNFVFFMKIYEKLNEKNSLVVWCQQVEPYVNANNLDEYLVAPIIPPRFLTAQDRATGKLNLEYRHWRLKDQMLLSWLLSTLSGGACRWFFACV